MKVYLDSEGNTPLVGAFDFGIVSAGESKKYTFYVKNDRMACLRELKFDVFHKEVTIVEAPTSLDSNEIQKLVIEWSPDVTVKEGLHTKLQIEGKEIWK
jgi:hypothetical protein